MVLFIAVHFFVGLIFGWFFRVGVMIAVVLVAGAGATANSKNPPTVKKERPLEAAFPSPMLAGGED